MFGQFGQTEQEFGACLASLMAALTKAGFVVVSGTDAARQLWTAAALISDPEAANYLFGKGLTITDPAKVVQVKMAACNTIKEAMAKKSASQLASLVRQQQQQLAALPVVPGATPVALAPAGNKGKFVALGVGVAAISAGLFFAFRD